MIKVKVFGYVQPRQIVFKATLVGTRSTRVPFIIIVRILFIAAAIVYASIRSKSIQPEQFMEDREFAHAGY